MERVFHTRWWDYHDMRFNIHGRICLETMLPFGLLGTFALYRINPFLMMLYHRLPGFISGKLAVGLVVLLLADLTISVCACGIFPCRTATPTIPPRSHAVCGKI